MVPYCFVLMPFGEKFDDNGKIIYFDYIYNQIMKPAIEQSEMKPIRADEEIIGGIIHKPMFERLMLCDYAIADLTTANANVFYELGIRHGVRPYSTVLVYAKGLRLPFDVALIRAIQYQLDEYGLPKNVSESIQSLVNQLKSCRSPSDDSPLYQLLADLPRLPLSEIKRLKTDTFRDKVEYSQKIKDRLSRARKDGPEAVKKVEQDINLFDADPAILIDLLLSYRAVEDWSSMVSLVEKMSKPLSQIVMIQEQLGFALNRLERHDEAETILKDLIDKHGPSSETNGILGRVYKDLWIKSKNSGNPAAGGYLNKSINSYLKGFESDWRDAYPGINAITMMEMKNPPDERQKELIPVVKYAVKRRLESKHPDYWDYATMLELLVISGEKELALEYLNFSISEIRESWEPKTTANNLLMIRKTREFRGLDVDWIRKIEDHLNNASNQL